MMNTLLRPHFPEQLKLWGDKNSKIWYRGNLELLKYPLVSVVGTREVTKQGSERTEKIINILVKSNYSIVSGLAKGVDTIAHTKTLELGGNTIAVIGTPIDECYPKENYQLKTKIEIEGLVLSCFAPKSQIYKSNFPKRNILMSFLSQFIIVTEASANSGTQHQVKAAVGLKKRVGFLASLAEKGYPWIKEALTSGYGFVINNPSDLISIIDKISNFSGKETNSLPSNLHVQISLPFFDEKTPMQSPELLSEINTSKTLLFSTQTHSNHSKVLKSCIPTQLFLPFVEETENNLKD